MPTNITPNTAWTTLMTVPVNGDPANASDVSQPVQALADRTEHLYQSRSPYKLMKTVFNYGANFIAPVNLGGAVGAAGFFSFSWLPMSISDVIAGDIILIEADFRATCGTTDVYSNFTVASPTQSAMNPTGTYHRTYFNTPSGGVVQDPKTMRDIRLVHRHVWGGIGIQSPAFYICSDRSDTFIAENARILAHHLRLA